MPEDNSFAAPRAGFRFRDSVSIKLDTPGAASLRGTPVAVASGRKKKRSLIARASDQEWAASALLFLLDVAGWFLIYGFTSLVRGDSYYSSPFTFLVIDLLLILVIVMSVYVVGGYDRSTEYRSLAYASEHLLAYSRPRW